MKSSYLSAGALACALALSACGGGEDVLVGGPIRGLTKGNLVLQNNGGSDMTLAEGTSSYYFTVGSDSAFDITVKTQPSNATCSVIDGKGTTSTFNILNVVVECTPITHKLGGTVTGLGRATGLEIINGADRKKIDPVIRADGTPEDPLPFQLSPVAEGLHYGVTVLAEPAGLDCSVVNGNGKMDTVDIANVQVNCVPEAAASTNSPGA